MEEVWGSDELLSQAPCLSDSVCPVPLHPCRLYCLKHQLLSPLQSYLLSSSAQFGDISEDMSSKHPFWDHAQCIG